MPSLSVSSPGLPHSGDESALHTTPRRLTASTDLPATSRLRQPAHRPIFTKIVTLSARHRETLTTPSASTNSNLNCDLTTTPSCIDRFHPKLRQNHQKQQTPSFSFVLPFYHPFSTHSTHTQRTPTTPTSLRRATRVFVKKKSPAFVHFRAIPPVFERVCAFLNF